MCVFVCVCVCRICEVQSVDGTTISCFTVRECEGSSRIGSRPRRYLFTGHGNGSIQLWDLTIAMDTASRGEERKKDGEGALSVCLCGCGGKVDSVIRASEGNIEGRDREEVVMR